MGVKGEKRNRAREGMEGETRELSGFFRVLLMGDGGEAEHVPWVDSMEAEG